MQRRNLMLTACGAITVAAMGVFIYVGMRPIVHTREGNTRAYIRVVSEIIEQFRRESGRYPANSEWPQVTLRPGVPLEPIRDGWGNPLQYRYPSQRKEVPFELWSLGADGKSGGEGEAADVGTWTK